MSFRAKSRKVSVVLFLNGVQYATKNFTYAIAVNEDPDLLLPGCAACAEVTVTVLGAFDADIIGTAIDLRITAKDMSAGATETHTLREFYVTGMEHIDGTNVTKLTCRDAMSFFEVDYVSALEFPAKATEVLGEIEAIVGRPVYYDTASVGDIACIVVPDMEIAEKPVGYTCREMLGYIAGMCGGFAVDLKNLQGGNVIYNGVGFIHYESCVGADSVAITRDMMYGEGLQFWTDTSIHTKVVPYVEFTIEEVTTEAEGDTSEPQSGDITYLQNPDDLADLEAFVSTNGSSVTTTENFWTPYWFIIERTDTEPQDGVPRYELYFLPAEAQFWTATYSGLFANECYLAATEKCVGYCWNVIPSVGTYELDWVNFTKNGTAGIAFSRYAGPPSYYEGSERPWKFVAASFDMYDYNTGELIFAANSEAVGSLRSGSAVTTTETRLVYGTGDYTNPFITANNLEVVAAQQKTVSWRPGTLRCRGCPTIPFGTRIVLEMPDGSAEPFLVSSITHTYDGGLSTVIESHGKNGDATKLSGVQRDLKRVRGMRALWNYKNAQE